MVQRITDFGSLSTAHLHPGAVPDSPPLRPILLIGRVPSPPVPKSPKVFERLKIGPDFGLDLCGEGPDGDGASAAHFEIGFLF